MFEGWSDANVPGLQVWLLGRFRVSVAGRAVRELERQSRPAALLKLLALSPGHRLHREEVLDQLWPDLDCEAALNNPHGTIYSLRRFLEPKLDRWHQSSFLHLGGGVLALRAPGGVQTDVDLFQRACLSAVQHRQLTAFEEALRLYAGELLPDDRYADWANGPREVISKN